MPFGYASAEQIVRDKSEYARKGIARGRSVAITTYADGILFVAENPSPTLHKISEMYDRIAFAAVGKYNEFENLRVAGVRFMDLRGYSYDRRDVSARALANVYAQTLGSIFSESMKPYEVELVVAEVGATAPADQIYRLTYDGSIAEERGFVAVGGQSDAVTAHLREHHQEGQSLQDTLQVALAALRAGSPAGSSNGDGPRPLGASTLEVAVLDRTRSRRLFKRIVGSQLERLIAPAGGTTGGDDAPPPGEAPPVT